MFLMKGLLQKKFLSPLQSAILTYNVTMILLTQISTNLIYQNEHGIHKDYYDKIWASRKPEGYVKPDDFWEIGLLLLNTISKTLN